MIIGRMVGLMFTVPSVLAFLWADFYRPRIIRIDSAQTNFLAI
jgi:hypothetical protein